jgi:crotonobetainyl-CoA:carnitine CoA-transferase CaiB-like acyl-CoA transferase
MSGAVPRLGPMLGARGPGMLENLRVLEVADETAEYCGLVLAGLGADVLKIEPPGGAPTRRIGPFLDDRHDSEGSLHFWSYNRGKRSLIFDPKLDDQRNSVLALLDGADVLLDSSRGNFLRDLGIDRDILASRCPSLIHACMTPFGDTGPWKDFKGSDLVHLALGGVMMNCGYDPDPAGRYDLPPIAPQLWHAYHIAGEQLAVGIVGALLHRLRTGEPIGLASRRNFPIGFVSCGSMKVCCWSAISSGTRRPRPLAPAFTSCSSVPQPILISRNSGCRRIRPRDVSALR